MFVYVLGCQVAPDTSADLLSSVCFDIEIVQNKAAKCSHFNSMNYLFSLFVREEENHDNNCYFNFVLIETNENHVVRYLHSLCSKFKLPNYSVLFRFFIRYFYGILFRFVLIKF